MKAALPIAILALLGAVPACRRDAPPSKEPSRAQVAAEEEEDEVPINFGGKITQKKRPLQTARKEDRLKERQEKVILSTEKSSPAALLVLEDGTLTVDVCREGYEKRRRIAPDELHATLWIGQEKLEFDLVAVDSTRDKTGRAYRFQAKRARILCGEDMLLVVDVPNLAGDGLERANFVVPAGYEPF